MKILKNKALPRLLAVVMTVLLAITIIPSFFASAATVEETAAAGEGEHTFTVQITATENTPFAGIQFTLKVSDPGAVVLNSYRTTGSDVADATVVTPVYKNGEYTFGFTSGDNAYSGNLDVGVISLTYRGAANATATITEANFIYFPEGGGNSTWLRKETNHTIVNISRAAAPPTAPPTTPPTPPPTAPPTTTTTTPGATRVTPGRVVPVVPVAPVTAPAVNPPVDEEQTDIPDENPPLAEEPPDQINPSPVPEEEPRPGDGIDSEENIPDPEIPLAGGWFSGNGAWALLNLLLSIAGAVFAIMMGVKVIDMRKQEKEEAGYEDAGGSDADKETKRGRIPLIVAVPLLAIAAFIIFFISQDIGVGQPMGLFDWWTPVHAVLLAGGVLCYSFAYRRD